MCAQCGESYPDRADPWLSLCVLALQQWHPGSPWCLPYQKSDLNQFLPASGALACVIQLEWKQPYSSDHSCPSEDWHVPCQTANSWVWQKPIHSKEAWHELLPNTGTSFRQWQTLEFLNRVLTTVNSRKDGEKSRRSSLGQTLTPTCPELLF